MDSEHSIKFQDGNKPLLLTSVLPANSFSYKLDNIYKAKQYRGLDQWSDGGGKRLVTVSTKCGNCDSNGKLEIVAGSSETLCHSQLITKPELVSHKNSNEEDDNEINYERSGNSDNGDNLVNHLAALRCE